MITENQAAILWMAEMVLGLVFSVLVVAAGARRLRRATTPAGRVLSAGSVAGGILGLVGCLTLLSTVYATAVALPACDPGSGSLAAYCEARTATVRLLLVSGIFPLILAIGTPLVVDWLGKRALSKTLSDAEGEG